MKIIYIVSEDIAKNTGIVQKIRAQTNIWKDKGHEVLIVSLSSSSKESFLNDSVILEIKKTRSIVSKIISYFTKAKKLDNVLAEFKPDVIYMRYVMYYPFLPSVLNKYAPYVIEINSDDVVETKIRNKKHFIYNYLFRNCLLSSAAGFVAVSNELKSNIWFDKFHKPSIVIGNGVDISAIKFYKSYTKKITYNVVFIGSPNQKWHGLDKVLYLANYAPDINFHLIGPSLEELKSINPNLENLKNITVYGYLEDTHAQQVIAKCDIGISSLARHRTKMNEASPLKSRQYLAQGLPIITGYKDTDEIIDQAPFVLNIGNYEQNVKDNSEKIIEFIKDKSNTDPIEIIKFAKENLEYSVKEDNRLLFFKKISDGNLNG
jgi:glycosyltransferase involved in cell wall biosynthesis